MASRLPKGTVIGVVAALGTLATGAILAALGFGVVKAVPIGLLAIGVFLVAVGFAACLREAEAASLRRRQAVRWG